MNNDKAQKHRQYQQSIHEKKQKTKHMEYTYSIHKASL